YGDKAYKLPAFNLKTDGYVVLCGKSAFDQLDSSIPKLYVPSFPVFANSGKLLYLEDAYSRLQSVAEYTDQWYGSGSSKEGCSLEKIDLQNQLSSALNWTASKASRGGTPGVENSVSATNADQVNPQLVSYEYLYPATVQLRFNKSMNSSFLSDLRNYDIGTELSVKSVRVNYPISDRAELTLSDSLSEGACLQLELFNLTCINGYLAETDDVYDVCRSRPLEEKDILINELLYYPLKDEAEFIELYNNSNNTIDLSELFIATRKTDGSLQYLSQVSDTPLRLDKQQYVCVSKDMKSIHRVYDFSVESVYSQPAKLPQFSNTGGTVVLLYKSESVIDEFPYSPGLHAVSSKNQQGVSLERKSVFNPTDEPANWTSSFDQKGATPGFENSFKNTGADAEHGEYKFRSDQKYFRPASQGYEQHWHLLYNLQDIPHKITLEIYSVNGVQVRALLRNKEIAGNGEVLWDGKDDNGSILPIAPYIVYLQYFDAKSRLKKEKYVVTLTN
ncbi:MAG: lamin tail domain-containing protein, partial [Bacteroidales bacterium]